MDANHGAFPRILVGGSGLVTLYLAVLVLFSHPLGFLGSIIVFGFWFLFGKLVHEVFAPEELLTGDQVEARPVRQAKREEFEDPGEYSTQLAKTVYALRKPRPAQPGGSRILGNAPKPPVSGGRVYQEKIDPEAERRREEAELIDMFRSL